MELLRAKTVKLLISHFGNDDRRIEHAMRVLYHAENIAANYENYDIDIVITSTLLHDVGIKPSDRQRTAAINYA